MINMGEINWLLDWSIWPKWLRGHRYYQYWVDWFSNEWSSFTISTWPSEVGTRLPSESRVRLVAAVNRPTVTTKSDTNDCPAILAHWPVVSQDQSSVGCVLVRKRSDCSTSGCCDRQEDRPWTRTRTRVWPTACRRASKTDPNCRTARKQMESNELCGRVVRW